MKVLSPILIGFLVFISSQKFALGEVYHSAHAIPFGKNLTCKVAKALVDKYREYDMLVDVQYLFQPPSIEVRRYVQSGAYCGWDQDSDAADILTKDVEYCFVGYTCGPKISPP